jgi:hypothetical protein
LSEGSEKVTVRLKRGAWEIEITCSQDKVQQVIESVLSGMSSREKISIEEEKKDEIKGETCRGLILKLWKEGWFSSPRSLSEVDDEIKKRGYNYDRTAVAHTLVDLVREGKLFRDGTARNYRYVQKFPPQTNDKIA